MRCNFRKHFIALPMARPLILEASAVTMPQCGAQFTPSVANFSKQDRPHKGRESLSKGLPLCQRIHQQKLDSADASASDQFCPDRLYVVEHIFPLAGFEAHEVSPGKAFIIPVSIRRIELFLMLAQCPD